MTFPQFAPTYQQFFANPQTLNSLFTIQITAAHKSKTPIHGTYTQFSFSKHLKKRTSHLYASYIIINPKSKP